MIVTNDDGKTLALGNLIAGRLQQGGSPWLCVFDFAVLDVPPGRGFYMVKVGPSRRPALDRGADA